MAQSSDQAETSLQLSIYKGSREDFEHSCGQCLNDGNDIEAHGFCIVCNEYLCITCFRAHGKNKASKHHTLLGESELQNLKKTEVSSPIYTDKCPVHTDGILIFYCTNHKELCCNDCVIISHENCQNNYIPEKYSEILKSTEYQKALQAIDTVQMTVDNVKLVANKEETEANTSNEAVLEKICVFEQDIHDLLERKLMTIKLDAVTKREANEHTLNRVFDTCNAVSSNLEILRKEILDSKEKKSLAQLFTAIKKTENVLKSDEVNDSIKMLRVTKSQYHFERSADMEKISSLCFGEIKDDDRKSRDAIINMTKARREDLMFVALYIGSTYMTFGILIKGKPYSVITKQWRSSAGFPYSKVSTSLLIDPDGHSVCAFGYQAEQKYDNLVKEGKETEYFFLRGDFILRIYKDMEKGITFVHDEAGKKLPSVLVLSTLLRVLYEEAVNFLKKSWHLLRIETEAHFVLTAPERFKTARQVLKEAAEQVEVVSENYTVVFETEAIFTYIQNPDHFDRYDSTSIKQCQKGDRYIVLDVTDEMSTITVYEVGEEKSLQLYHEPVESWEAGSLRQEIEQMLSSIFGHHLWQTCATSYQDTYHKTMSEHVRNIRSIKPGKSCTFQIPSELRGLVEHNEIGTMKDLIHKSTSQGDIRYAGNRLRIGYSKVEMCFQPIVSTITSALRLVLQEKLGLGCHILVMTGDLSNYQILQNCLKREFLDLHIIIPNSPEIAVVVGAAVLGRFK